MSKSKDLKISKKELENIQNKVKAINSLQMNIGGLEVQKASAIQLLNANQAELNVIQQELQKKYGDATVNLETGIIKENKDGSLNKKN
ncbi:MAG: hypothetical protein ACYTE0_06440 [Planctomycetota bacterium]|jgi:allophanate hydrolase subunit 1